MRNLTPFPVRDAFASALLQPSEQPQFTAYGHLSDDLDLTVGRRRTRRISTHSLNTLRSTKLEDGTKGEDVQGSSTSSPEHRGRMRAGSRISFSSAGSLGPSASAGTSSRTFSTTGVASTFRISNRPRTSSTTSSVGSNIHPPVPSAMIHSSSTGPVSLSAMLPDNSQKGLEKVIKSRLVETFISITVAPSSLKTGSFNETHPEAVPPRSRSSTPPHITSSLREKIAQRKSVPTNNSATRKDSKVDSSSQSRGPLSKRPTSRTTTPTRANTQTRPAPSGPARLNGKTQTSSSAPSLPKFTLNLKRPSSPSSTAQISTPPPTLPNYFSPIHRPSTNPSFAIDARSKYEFADWTDTGGERLKIDIWGKVEIGWPGAENSSGTLKGKEKEWLRDAHGRPEWKVLEQWNVNLADLVPLPDDVRSSMHPRRQTIDLSL